MLAIPGLQDWRMVQMPWTPTRLSMSLIICRQLKISLIFVLTMCIFTSPADNPTLTFVFLHHQWILLVALKVKQQDAFWSNSSVISLFMQYNLCPLGNLRPADVPKMCNYFINYYVFSSCSQPDSHILKTSLDGNKENCCSASPHDRFIVVIGRCHLCSRWKISTIICYAFSAVGSVMGSSYEPTQHENIMCSSKCYRHNCSLYAVVNDLPLTLEHLGSRAVCPNEVQFWFRHIWVSLHSFFNHDYWSTQTSESIPS